MGKEKRAFMIKYRINHSSQKYCSYPPTPPKKNLTNSRRPRSTVFVPPLSRRGFHLKGTRRRRKRVAFLYHGLRGRQRHRRGPRKVATRGRRRRRHVDVVVVVVQRTTRGGGGITGRQETVRWLLSWWSRNGTAMRMAVKGWNVLLARWWRRWERRQTKRRVGVRRRWRSL